MRKTFREAIVDLADEMIYAGQAEDDFLPGFQSKEYLRGYQQACKIYGMELSMILVDTEEETYVDPEER